MSAGGDTSDALLSLWARVKNTAHGFARRLLAHFLSFTASVVAYTTLFSQYPGGAGGVCLAFGVYVGFICLFPRGDPSKADWRIPTGAGIATAAALMLAGLPWQFTPWFAGWTTWLTRLCNRKGAMGWEWAALPWLTLPLFVWAGELASPVPKAPAFGLALCAAPLGGTLLFRAWRRRKQALESAAPDGPAETPGRSAAPENLRAAAARLPEYERSVRTLLQRRDSLPETMRGPVLEICAGAQRMLECMRADSEDLVPGDRFLGRYLTAAQTVVDEYVRLSGADPEHAVVGRALSGTEDLLIRLAAAFRDEHRRMLRDDTINFAAELGVLDKLLKMRGR